MQKTGFFTTIESLTPSFFNFQEVFSLIYLHNLGFVSQTWEINLGVLNFRSVKRFHPVKIRLNPCISSDLLSWNFENHWGALWETCCTFTSYGKRNRKLGVHRVLRKFIHLFIQLLIYIDLTSQQTLLWYYMPALESQVRMCASFKKYIIVCNDWKHCRIKTITNVLYDIIGRGVIKNSLDRWAEGCHLGIQALKTLVKAQSKVRSGTKSIRYRPNLYRLC